ncbi:hypothetical protein [Streptomyces sp. RFCAC02]|uniref:hypothetical protein n=1 Tax=Streptomyces sp. RFCAC02 TaxID=2499143 RepID=UPI0010208DF5|nr:hypothetical protein [Streptomyces sp. RFCAC02]
MSTLVIIILAVVVLAVLALVLAPSTRTAGAGRLRHRFGPEYDRTVARHGGDTRAARKELAARLREHGRLRMRPLSAEDRERYRMRWARVQEKFVESPGGAVAEADHLLTQLIHERGYPSHAYDDQVSALSVHHPRHVEGYRTVHALAGREPADGAVTEELREAVVRARDLFNDLLSAQPEDEQHHKGGRMSVLLRNRSDRTPTHSRTAGTTPGGTAPTKGGV